MKNIFISLVALLLLASCGLSEGDSVIVLPNDSTIRTDIIIGRQNAGLDLLNKIMQNQGVIISQNDVILNAITGTFIKKNGDAVVITDSNGKFKTYKADEVFAASDEYAQKLSAARVEFYKVYFQNQSEMDKDEIIDLIKERAEKAELNDWVEFLEIFPDINAFNKRLPKKGMSVSAELIDDWQDIFDSLEGLEQEVAELSDPNGKTGNFATIVFDKLDVSASEAINGWVKDMDIRVSGNTPELVAVSLALKNALKFVPLKVEEAKHQALLIGKQLTDEELKKERNIAMKPIFENTIPISIMIANKSLKNKLTGLDLAEFLVNEVGCPKEGLAQFHGKESWDDLISAVKKQDEWLSALMEDNWNGKVVIKDRGGRTTELNSTLIFTFETSLLNPVAILSYGQGAPLRGVVNSQKAFANSENSFINVRIKDALGNWHWIADINAGGTLNVRGSFPYRRYKYQVNAKFYSPAVIKRHEEAKKVKIQQLTTQLKNEPWYGVTFFKSDGKWVPNPALIKLDFNQNIFFMQDIGFDSEKHSISGFSFDIDASGKGNISDQEGMEIKHWVGGNRWNFVFDEASQTLTASILRSKKNRNKEWQVRFVTERSYLKRLQLLMAFSHSSWETGRMDSKGVLMKRAKKGGSYVRVNGRLAKRTEDNRPKYAEGLLTIKNGRIENNIVKLEGDLLFHQLSSHVVYITVPAMEHGAVLATLGLGESRFRQRIVYSDAPGDDNAKFVSRSRSNWGYMKISGSPLDTNVPPSKATTEISSAAQANQMKKKLGESGLNGSVAVETSQNIVVGQPVKPSVQHAENRHEAPKTTAALRHKLGKTTSQKKTKRQGNGISKTESQILNQGIKTLEALL